MTTKQAVDAFIASLRTRNVPHNTVKSYAHDLRQFSAVVPTEIEEVTASSIQQFLEQQSHLTGCRATAICADLDRDARRRYTEDDNEEGWHQE